MGNEISIRRAGAGDLDKIFAFVCYLEETSFDYSVFCKCYEQNFKATHHIYLVAVNEQDEVVGFISCHGQILLHHCGMVWEIQELYVDRYHRDEGTGKLLLQSLEEEIGREPYATLEAAVNKSRKNAHSFYTHNGFAQTHLKFSKDFPG